MYFGSQAYLFSPPEVRRRHDEGFPAAVQCLLEDGVQVSDGKLLAKTKLRQSFWVCYPNLSFVKTHTSYP